MKTPAILIDLDGTLCNIEHRKSLIQKTPPDWGLFHAKMIHDTPNLNVAAMIVAAIGLGQVPIFVTGRKAKYREKTRLWLQQHFPLFTNILLLMRGNLDDRPDDAVKEDLYHAIVESSFDVRLVLEDRDHVVAMWRRLGLECWQVAPGNY